MHDKLGHIISCVHTHRTLLKGAQAATATTCTGHTGHKTSQASLYTIEAGESRSQVRVSWYSHAWPHVTQWGQTLE